MEGVPSGVPGGRGDAVFATVGTGGAAECLGVWLRALFVGSGEAAAGLPSPGVGGESDVPLAVDAGETDGLLRGEVKGGMTGATAAISPEGS